jgi:hypothetical protein
MPNLRPNVETLGYCHVSLRDKDRREHPKASLASLVVTTFCRSRPYRESPTSCSSESGLWFVGGCFWHECPRHERKPDSNRIYYL